MAWLLAARAALEQETVRFESFPVGPAFRARRRKRLSGVGVIRQSALSAVHDRDRAITQIAVPGHQPDLRAVDLMCPAVAPKLAHQLDDVVEAGNVRLGQQPAMRIGG